MRRSLAELEIARDLKAEANGDMGRGVRIDSIEDWDTTGYLPYAVPGTSQTRHRVYGPEGHPSGAVWMGFISMKDPTRRVNVEMDYGQ